MWHHSWPVMGRSNFLGVGLFSGLFLTLWKYLLWSDLAAITKPLTIIQFTWLTQPGFLLLFNTCHPMITIVAEGLELQPSTLNPHICGDTKRVIWATYAFSAWFKVFLNIQLISKVNIHSTHAFLLFMQNNPKQNNPRLRSHTGVFHLQSRTSPTSNLIKLITHISMLPFLKGIHTTLVQSQSPQTKK